MNKDEAILRLMDKLVARGNQLLDEGNYEAVYEDEQFIQIKKEIKEYKEM